MNNHRWNTQEFIDRAAELSRKSLHNLYPSEAWALFRVIPGIQNVLDLGCGTGAMASIINQISKETNYTGVDHQETLVKNATSLFPYAKFYHSDLEDYINKCQTFECIMSWSVIKSFGNWKEIIKEIVKKATKKVIFDIRIANIDVEIFDDSICWAQYGDVRGAHVLTNYTELKRTIKSLDKFIKRAEIVAYKSDYGKNVHYSIKKPDLFLVCCVLEIKNQREGSHEIDFYEQLPNDMER